jgi:hypothetical protein
MWHLRLLLPLTLGLVFVLTVSARAQNSPYSYPQGNVGSWSWDKPQPKIDEESEEREPGETAWERLQAERAPAEQEPPRREVLKSLSPLGLLQWWRKEKKAELPEPTESTKAIESTEVKEPETDGSATEEE